MVIIGQRHAVGHDLAESHRRVTPRFKDLTYRRTKSEYRNVLFEIGSAPQLVGIARLAQQSTVLASKSKVRYFELPTRSVLNRCSNPQMPFTWTINPYRGCEFGLDGLHPPDGSRGGAR